jgi:PAS domain S-box-containing protein
MDRIRKFIEKSLSESNGGALTLLTSLLDTLPYAVFIVGVPKDTIAWCNSASLSVFGYEKSELVEDSMQPFHVDAHQFIKFKSYSASPISSGKPYQGRFWMMRKNGQVFPAVHLVTPIQRLAGSHVVIAIVDDLSKDAESEFGDKYELLTEREKFILNWTMRGLTAKAIARKAHISHRTVEAHRSSIIQKFEVDSMIQLISGLVAASKPLALEPEKLR